MAQEIVQKIVSGRYPIQWKMGANASEICAKLGDILPEEGGNSIMNKKTDDDSTLLEGIEPVGENSTDQGEKAPETPETPKIPEAPQMPEAAKSGKEEKAPKAPKAPKTPKPAKEPKAVKEPKPPKAPKPAKEPKPAKKTKESKNQVPETRESKGSTDGVTSFSFGLLLCLGVGTFLAYPMLGDLWVYLASTSFLLGGLLCYQIYYVSKREILQKQDSMASAMASQFSQLQEMLQHLPSPQGVAEDSVADQAESPVVAAVPSDLLFLTKEQVAEVVSATEESLASALQDSVEKLITTVSQVQESIASQNMDNKAETFKMLDNVAMIVKGQVESSQALLQGEYASQMKRVSEKQDDLQEELLHELAKVDRKSQETVEVSSSPVEVEQESTLAEIQEEMKAEMQAQMEEKIQKEVANACVTPGMGEKESQLLALSLTASLEESLQLSFATLNEQIKGYLSQQQGENRELFEHNKNFLAGAIGDWNIALDGLYEQLEEISQELGGMETLSVATGSTASVAEVAQEKDPEIENMTQSIAQNFAENHAKMLETFKDQVAGKLEAQNQELKLILKDVTGENQGFMTEYFDKRQTEQAKSMRDAFTTNFVRLKTLIEEVQEQNAKQIGQLDEKLFPVLAEGDTVADSAEDKLLQGLDCHSKLLAEQKLALSQEISSIYKGLEGKLDENFRGQEAHLLGLLEGLKGNQVVLDQLDGGQDNWGKLQETMVAQTAKQEENLEKNLEKSFEKALGDQFHASLQEKFQEKLEEKLQDQLQETVGEILEEKLEEKLEKKLEENIKGSFQTHGAALEKSLHEQLKTSLEENFAQNFQQKLEQELEKTVESVLETSLELNFENHGLKLQENLSKILGEMLETTLETTLETSLETNLDKSLEKSLENNLGTSLASSMEKNLGEQKEAVMAEFSKVLEAQNQLKHHLQDEIQEKVQYSTGQLEESMEKFQERLDQIVGSSMVKNGAELALQWEKFFKEVNEMVAVQNDDIFKELSKFNEKNEEMLKKLLENSAEAKKKIEFERLNENSLDSSFGQQSSEGSGLEKQENDSKTAETPQKTAETPTESQGNAEDSRVEVAQKGEEEIKTYYKGEILEKTEIYRGGILEYLVLYGEDGLISHSKTYDHKGNLCQEQDYHKNGEVRQRTEYSKTGKTLSHFSETGVLLEG